MERIGFGYRLLAYIIDIFFICLGYLFLFLILFLTNNLTADKMQGQSSLQLVAVILGLLYWSSEIYFAGTPGKHLLGLRIGSEDGGEAPMNDLIKRFCLKHIATVGGVVILAMLIFAIVIPPLAILLAFVAIAVSITSLVVFFGHLLILTSSRQGLHDKFGFTAVYRKSQPAPVQKPVTPERPRRRRDPNELLKPRW